jgi:hypothetical protein
MAVISLDTLLVTCQSDPQNSGQSPVTIKQIPTGSFFYFQPAAIYTEENIVTNSINDVRGTELYQLTLCL